LATLSWIDPKSGLPEVDRNGMPAETLGLQGIQSVRNCRFAHLLTCSIFVENGKITRCWVDKPSTIYRRPSYQDTPSVVYKDRRDMSDWNSERAIFVQTVGCRTQAPELIGGAVGMGGASGTGILDPILGYRIGREAAELVSSFPPIWTKLRILMRADGACEGGLIGHSLFPSISFYEGVQVNQMVAGQISTWIRRGYYDGVPNYKAWNEQGWGQGNPWRVENPAWVRNTRTR